MPNIMVLQASNPDRTVITRMYVDVEAKWPITFEITLSTKGAFIKVPLEIVDTNIPVLKRT